MSEEMIVSMKQVGRRWHFILFFISFYYFFFIFIYIIIFGGRGGGGGGAEEDYLSIYCRQGGKAQTVTFTFFYNSIRYIRTCGLCFLWKLIFRSLFISEISPKSNLCYTLEREENQLKVEEEETCKNEFGFICQKGTCAKMTCRSYACSS